MLCRFLYLPEAFFSDRIKSSSSGSVATSFEEDSSALSKQDIVRCRDVGAKAEDIRKGEIDESS